MEIQLIFVIVIMFYFCVIFPLQMRRYMLKRQQRIDERNSATSSNNTRVPAYVNNVRNNLTSVERTDHQLIFGVNNRVEQAESQTNNSDTSHLEAEHRQQIIIIQREIEQEAIRRRTENESNAPPNSSSNNTNDSTLQDQAAEYSQQIIDLQREIERQAIQRREERRPDALGPHMPPRLVNSATIRSPIYAITSSTGVVGASNSDINYPNPQPLSPNGDIRFAHIFNNVNNSTIHPSADYSQQIIDLQREIERQAIRREDDHRPDAFGPHMPSRLINSTTIRSPIYAITSNTGVIGASNSDTNYPNAPPLSPNGDRETNNRSTTGDDELPSYDQAIALCYTTTPSPATVSRA